MAVTDDERREIAENLRYDADYPGCAIQYMEQFISMLRETVFNDAICDADYSEIFQRLADLIEPSCDRDALLALAEELEGTTRHLNVWQAPFLNAAETRDLARRIREACGEVVA